MLLYYVRHGDPIYNPDSLTPLGQRQAEAVGKRLATYGMDKIYASPAMRARLTGAPLCEMLHKDMTILDWCDEALVWEDLTVTCDDNGGRTWAFFHTPTRELFRSKEVRALGNEFYTHPAFADQKTYGVSRFETGLARVRQEIDNLLATHGYVRDKETGGFIAERPNNDRIAIFAHQGFGIAFLSCLLDIPYPTFATTFDLSHSSVTVIEFDAPKGKLCFPCALQVANDSHIYHAGLPTKYNNEIYV